MSTTKPAPGPRRRKSADPVSPSETAPWTLKNEAGPVGPDESDDAVDEGEIRRRLVDWANLHMLCRRKACRRAGACAEPEVPCMREFMPELRAHVFPKLRQHLRETMTGAPPDHTRRAEVPGEPDP